MRLENSTPSAKATDDELLFHATLIHATGGMVLTGDDMRTYGDLEKSRLAELCPPSGKAMRFDSEDFSIGRSEDGTSVALLNWTNEPRDFTVPLPGLRRSAKCGHKQTSA